MHTLPLHLSPALVANGGLFHHSRNRRGSIMFFCLLLVLQPYLVLNGASVILHWLLRKSVIQGRWCLKTNPNTGGTNSVRANRTRVPDGRTWGCDHGSRVSGAGKLWGAEHIFSNVARNLKHFHGVTYNYILLFCQLIQSIKDFLDRSNV